MLRQDIGSSECQREPTLRQRAPTLPLPWPPAPSLAPDPLPSILRPLRLASPHTLALPFGPRRHWRGFHFAFPLPFFPGVDKALPPGAVRAVPSPPQQHVRGWTPPLNRGEPSLAPGAGLGTAGGDRAQPGGAVPVQPSALPASPRR